MCLIRWRHANCGGGGERTDELIVLSGGGGVVAWNCPWVLIERRIEEVQYIILHLAWEMDKQKQTLAIFAC